MDLFNPLSDSVAVPIHAEQNYLQLVVTGKD
jgi:hypothetical protein